MDKHRSKIEIENIVKDYLKSNMSMNKYSKAHGIPVTSLCFWLKKANRTNDVSFVEVTDKVEDSELMLTLKIGEGVIEFPSSYLSTVIKELKSC